MLKSLPVWVIHSPVMQKKCVLKNDQKTKSPKRKKAWCCKTDRIWRAVVEKPCHTIPWENLENVRKALGKWIDFSKSPHSFLFLSFVFIIFCDLEQLILIIYSHKKYFLWLPFILFSRNSMNKHGALLIPTPECGRGSFLGPQGGNKSD